MDNDLVDATALAFSFLERDKIVWQSNGTKYTIDVIKDSHLQNIIVMTIRAAPSYNTNLLRREARRRKLFLADGWRTWRDGIILNLAKEYAKSGDELDKMVLSDALEEQGSQLSAWIRNSPIARELADRIHILGD